jgi:hypothetical protein
VDDLSEDAELIFTYATLQENFNRRANRQFERKAKFLQPKRQANSTYGNVPYQLFCLNHPRSVQVS